MPPGGKLAKKAFLIGKPARIFRAGLMLSVAVYWISLITSE